jgi:hypothetical protein
MSESSAQAPCPDGHGDTRRLLSIAGVTGVAGTAPARDSGPARAATGGGCCGGGCCG